MSRPSGSPANGLSALRAAVAEVRRDELGRAARALLVAGEAGVAFRVASPARGGGRKTTVPAQASPDAVVPTPTAAGDDDTDPEVSQHAPPEGDTAITHALVERAQTGDAEAFGELYDRYVDLVYRYIYYRVGTSQLAEDLTSETFLRALRRISTFTWQGRDVGAWFVTIARNLIADHYKSGRYRLEMTSDDVSTVGEATQLVSDSPENAVLEAMQNKVLLEAVKQLNAEQQECIVLRFLQGLSVAETAQAMGKNDGAIKALQYRAIRSLGRLLPEGVEL